MIIRRMGHVLQAFLMKTGHCKENKTNFYLRGGKREGERPRVLLRGLGYLYKGKRKGRGEAMKKGGDYNELFFFLSLLPFSDLVFLFLYVGGTEMGFCEMGNREWDFYSGQGGV